MKNSTEKEKGWWDKSGESHRKYRKTFLVVYGLLGGFLAYSGYEYAYDKLIHDCNVEKYARLLQNIAVVLLALPVSFYLWYLRNHDKQESLAEARKNNQEAKQGNQFNSYSTALKLFLTEEKPKEATESAEKTNSQESPKVKPKVKPRGQTNREVGLILLMKLKNEQELYGEDINLVTPYKDLTRAYLPYVDLRGANLTEARLYKADLQEANLTKAILERADLIEAKLQGADLIEAKLKGADLEGAKLDGADLTRANLTRANLGGVSLQRADLREANLRGADLGEVNLQGADLTKANLQTANLREADLGGKWLIRINLSQASQSVISKKATLQGAEMFIKKENLTDTPNRAGMEKMLKNNCQDIYDSETEMFKRGIVQVRIIEGEDKEKYSFERIGQGMDLRGMNLRRMDLRGMDLQGMDLRGKNLQRTNLIEAKLQRANLTEADLTEADLWGAELLINEKDLVKTLNRGDLENMLKSNYRDIHDPKTGKLKSELVEVKIIETGDGKYFFLKQLNPQQTYEGVDLRGRNLTRADLVEENLYKADLREANLKEAKLYRANLQRTKLDGANLKEAKLYRANLQRAKLDGANLEGANLDRADLREADLLEANLQGADLTEADLTAADLTEAKLLINEENLTKTFNREELENMLKSNYRDIHDPKTGKLKSELVEVKIIAAGDGRYSFKKSLKAKKL